MESPKINVAALSQAHWSEEDKAKAEDVLQFVQLIMNDHNFNQVREKYSVSRYTQHNRTIADGLEGIIATINELIKSSPEFSYDVKRVFVDGNDVIVHSHATLKAAHRGDESKGLNIVDIWRIEDGHLVEHWDAVEGIDFSMRLYGLLSRGKVRNGNGVF